MCALSEEEHPHLSLLPPFHEDERTEQLKDTITSEVAKLRESLEETGTALRTSIGSHLA